jgi:hypothetical protein
MKIIYLTQCKSIKSTLTFLLVCIFIGLQASAQSADTLKIEQSFDKNQGQWQSYVYIGASAVEIGGQTKYNPFISGGSLVKTFQVSDKFYLRSGLSFQFYDGGYDIQDQEFSETNTLIGVPIYSDFTIGHIGNKIQSLIMLGVVPKFHAFRTIENYTQGLDETEYFEGFNFETRFGFGFRIDTSTADKYSSLDILLNFAFDAFTAGYDDDNEFKLTNYGVVNIGYNF